MIPKKKIPKSQNTRKMPKRKKVGKKPGGRGGLILYGVLVPTPNPSKLFPL
jgi:hypothetical protein